MASSKLPPSQVMNATSTFWPSASSPASVDDESASGWPATHALAAHHDRPLRDAGALVGAHELSQAPRVEAAILAAHHDLLAGDASRPRRRPATGRPGPSRARCAPPYRCRPAALAAGAAAPPGAACSSPSGRGWRRRARGTESARLPPTSSASARRPCSRPARARTLRKRSPWRAETSSSASEPSSLMSTLAWAMM